MDSIDLWSGAFFQAKDLSGRCGSLECADLSALSWWAASRRDLTNKTKSKAARGRSQKRRQVGALQAIVLDKYYGLGTGDFESAATLLACQHVVNSDHVVARFLIAHTVLLVGATWGPGFLRSLQPADFVFHPFAAMRTTVCCLLGFLSLVEKILFVHNYLSSALQFAQVAEAIDSCLVPVAPAEVKRVASDNTYIDDGQLVRNILRLQRALPGPFVYALRARASAS